jgi:epoxyqueuosine reductase QueG
MEKLTRNVVDTLLDWGADLVGIAPVDRFVNAPAGHKPTDFMPECKSVISVALHIFNGMADVWGEYDQPGKTITPYLFYGYGLTNLESSRMVNRMAKLLEYQGHKTLCFMPTWISSFYKYFEETAATNKVKAEFSHRHAAAAAGLGTLGWNGLGLTPEFGSMQRYNSILTSAELEPTPLYKGPELCRAEDCGKKCVRVCPAGAFSETESQSLAIEDKTITYSVHDNIRCAYGIHAMIEGSGGRSNMKIPEGPGQAMNWYAELEGDGIHMFDRGMLDNCFGIICGDFCGKCLHMCPSRELTAKDMKGYDLSKRSSSLNRYSLA